MPMIFNNFLILDQKSLGKMKLIVINKTNVVGT